MLSPCEWFCFRYWVVFALLFNWTCWVVWFFFWGFPPLLKPLKLLMIRSFWGADCDMIWGMMKFAGCSVTASLTPIQSVIQKSHPRLSSSILQESLSKPSSWSPGIQKLRQGPEAEMVARRYSPPWFRWDFYIISNFPCSLNVYIYWLKLAFLHFLSVAPMMDWTDNHYRTLARLITKHAWLYTEMLAAETIVYQKDNLVSLRSPLENS